MKYIYSVLISSLIMATFSCNGDKEKGNNIESIKVQDNQTKNLNEKPDSSNWYFDKIIGQTIYFKFNKQFKTNLYDLKYIGQLKTKSKAPYLILSGRNCNECDENISIFIHSPSDGPMKNEARQTRYSYPGKELDYATNKLIFESRMFYGDCLNNKNESVVWLQKNLNEKGVFENELLTVEVINDSLKETSKKVDSLNFEKYIPKCKELPGTSMTSEP